MNDILFGNNNQSAIKRLAQKSYHANQRRNLFATLALALTAFMITSVVSLGFSYVETEQMQQIRAMGTTADVAITYLTEKQAEELRQSKLVSVLGLSQRLGSVETGNLGDAKLGLTWIDGEEWEKHRLPAISDVHGAYPKLEKEVMLPLWVLQEMDIPEPQLGMKIPLTYWLESDSKPIAKNFVLSGYFTDYTTARVGKRGSIYVSQSFAANAGLPFDGITSAMISFQGTESVDRSCEKLKAEIAFSSDQSFDIVPSSHQNASSLMAAAAFIVVLIMISGYLLVYNILYISISRDTRFYGQLKTLGSTKRQIRKIVRWQILRTAAVGIPIGLLAGGGVSLVIVPLAMNMMYADSGALGTKISFSPILFLGAAIFALITAYLGSMKPARIAGSISPVAASRYTDTAVKTTGQRKSHRFRLPRMALHNIFRSPKSATLTFGSLFLGLCLFLISTGLLSCLNPETYAEQWGESDFVLTCGVQDGDASITEEMISNIQAMDGVQNIRLTYSPRQATVSVLYDQEVFGAYVNSLDGVSGLDFSDPEAFDKYTNNFFSGIYGLDRAYVEERNETLAHPIDLAAFESGKTILLPEILDSEGNPLILPGQPITILVGNVAHTFTVADGFLEEDFQSARGNLRGTAPNLYLSQQALKSIFPETKIFRVDFDTSDGSSDKQILEGLQAMFASSPDVRILSRYEKRLEMGEYLFTSRILATGLSATFLLIGLMNFINTMVVSVNTRRYEFAVLESIGMTKKQIKTVLLWEGGCYWIIAFFLIATLGTGIYIPLYMAFRQAAYYAVFRYPFAQMLLAAGAVLLVCLAVPIVCYNKMARETVVERLRAAE